MLMNLETVLALLLLSLVGGGIPSAAGQNVLSNITTSDIIDLVGNATESETDNESPIIVGGGIPSAAGKMYCPILLLATLLILSAMRQKVKQIMNLLFL